MDENSGKVSFKIRKDEEGFERLVYAEVIVPDVLNTYGDFHTRESVREFAYGFMIAGFGVDVGHDEMDMSESLHVVESFIARESDPDFIEGAWVIGLYVDNDNVWSLIRSGELNGFSYQAWVNPLEVEVEVLDQTTRFGRTQPSLDDGHTHDFFILVGEDDRYIAGGTSEADGHSHPIRRHTFTEKADGHSHIYNFIQGNGGI